MSPAPNAQRVTDARAREDARPGDERPAGGTAAQGPVRWRAIVVPAEHGGWGLTIEPALLGMLVAPSVAGAALALAAVVAFLVRTPLKLVLVDTWRGRRLARTTRAAAVGVAELAVLALLAALAVWTAGWTWVVPVLVALPLVAVELWFDMRSRSRRLVPELCGAAGVAAVVAAIVLAGGGSARLAAALWLVLVARAVASIPFVRVQILRLRRGAARAAPSDWAQGTAIAIGALAVAIDRGAAGGLLALLGLAALHTLWVRRAPVVAKVLGVRELATGIALVLVTAVGVWLT